MSKKNNNNLEEDDFDKFPEVSEGYKKPVSEKIGTAIMNRTRRAGEVVENLFAQESNTNKTEEQKQDKKETDPNVYSLDNLNPAMQFNKNVGNPNKPSLFYSLLNSIGRVFEKLKDFLLDSFEKSTKEARDKEIQSKKQNQSFVKRSEPIKEGRKDPAAQSQEILIVSKGSHENTHAVQQGTTSKKDAVKDTFNEVTKNEKNELFASIDNGSKKTKSPFSSLISKVSSHDDNKKKNPGTTKNTNNKKNSKSLQ